jgi:hypothetical protein
MILAFLQRGLTAGLLSVASIVGIGAAVAQPATGNPRAVQGKPAPAQSTPAKPAAGQAPGTARTPASQNPAAAASTVPATGPGGTSLLASFGDWGVYTAQTGRAKICYAVSQPKERLPKNLNRDPAYVFVSFRPSENVRNEVAVVMGTAAQDGGEAEAVVGAKTYALVTKDQNAWVKNPTEENQVVATMSKGQALVVKASGKRGGKLIDRYSLNGFGQALDRARKECS